MTHEELCERARRWLAGTWRCEPVFSNIASCDEIPDAIGWSSVYGHRGSTVIECKTSVSDFYADKYKHFMWEHPTHKLWRMNMGRITRKKASDEGFNLVQVPMMGDYRYYFCEAGVLSAELIAQHMPDHGLLCKDGRAVREVRPAPRRELVDKDAEIRYLRFAIINSKKPFVRVAATPEPTLFEAEAERCDRPAAQYGGVREPMSKAKDNPIRGNAI